MKKNLIFIFLFGIIILGFFGISYVISINGVKVESFSADITIESNGDMLVREQRTVRYPEGYSVTFRDIGYDKYHPDNPLYQERSNQASFDRESIKVWVESNGKRLSPSEFIYRLSGERDELGQIIECPAGNYRCESIFIQVPGGMKNKMTFGYTYRIKGAITEYQDIAELNWVLLNDIESKIDKIDITLNLPDIPKDDILAWGHGTNGTVEIEDNKVILKVEAMKKSDFLEFRILMPRNNFNVPEENRISRNMKQEIINYQNSLAIETNRRIVIAQILFYGTFVMIALMLAFSYIAYQRYDKEHQAKFTGKYYRELPAEYSPAEMSYLYYFRKINDEDLTATILDLIRRNYLIFDQNNQGINDKDPDFKLIYNSKIGRNNLKRHENHMLTWFIDIIGNGKEVTLKQIEDYPKASYEKARQFQLNAQEFVRFSKQEGSNHDFFDKRLGRGKGKMLTATIIPGLYILLALVLKVMYHIDVLIPLVASFIVLIVYASYISTIDKRSINGNEDYVKWKAFKAFLLDFGNMKDYPIPGIVVWEHYLVYATSLKVADKVMEQLEVRLPKVVDQEGLSDATFLGFAYRYPHYHYFHTFGRINTSISLARHNQNQTIVRQNSQKVGGFGRGGGFGGGSSFGGGGGGFRSR